MDTAIAQKFILLDEAGFNRAKIRRGENVIDHRAVTDVSGQNWFAHHPQVFVQYLPPCSLFLNPTKGSFWHSGGTYTTGSLLCRLWKSHVMKLIWMCFRDDKALKAFPHGDMQQKCGHLKISAIWYKS